MPRWGRPPGAHLGRPTRGRGGPWVDDNSRIEEMDSEAEEQQGLRDDRLYNRQLAGLQGGKNVWRRPMVERDGYENAPGQVDGADYDIYEDTDSTVAYAVQLAMKDNEEWLVEKALERIRRAHSEGQSNVKLSQREIEALERKRLRAGPESTVDNKRSEGTGNGATWRGGISAAPPPPYPVDGAWARTTSASASPQSSTTTLRSPLQPPFSGSLDRPPAFLAPPASSRPYPDDYQRVPAYQALRSRGPDHSLHSPIDPLPGSPSRPRQLPYNNVSSQASFFSPDPAALAPQPVVSINNSGDRGSQINRRPISNGDQARMVEVIEHKAPGSPTSAAGVGSRQRSS